LRSDGGVTSRNEASTDAVYNRVLPV
jgi:hypothetical protein